MLYNFYIFPSGPLPGTHWGSQANRGIGGTETPQQGIRLRLELEVGSHPGCEATFATICLLTSLFLHDMKSSKGSAQKSKLPIRAFDHQHIVYGSQINPI